MTNRNESIQSLEGLQGHDFDNGADDLWSLYGKEALVYDESWIKTLKGDMGSVLIFVRVYFPSGQPKFDINPGSGRLVYSPLFSLRSSCQRSRI